MLKLQFPDNPGKSLWLVGEALRLGSDPGNDIVLSGLAVQPWHAAIQINNDSLQLRTEAACYVNQLPARDGQLLHAGDELRIGTHTLQIIDPKQSASAAQSGVNLAAENRPQELSGWSLKALHPKLKDKPFLLKSRTVIGRGKDCDISIPYQLLSRQHALFRIDDKGLVVEDLKSGNGTFVNGKRIIQARLQAGDKIAFAKLPFQVVGPEPKEATAVVDKKTMVRPKVDVSRLPGQKSSQTLTFSDEKLDDTDVNTQSVPDNKTSRYWAWILVAASLIVGLLLAARVWLGD